MVIRQSTQLITLVLAAPAQGEMNTERWQVFIVATPSTMGIQSSISFLFFFRLLSGCACRLVLTPARSRMTKGIETGWAEPTASLEIAGRRATWA